MADHEGLFCPSQGICVSLSKRGGLARGVIKRIMLLFALKIDYRGQGKDERDKLRGYCNNPGKRCWWPGSPVRAMTSGHMVKV